MFFAYLFNITDILYLKLQSEYLTKLIVHQIMVVR
jgi:hypothetical protein